MKHQDDFHDELLSGYLDGELTAQEQGLVEHALAENAELRQTYEELRALRGTLQALPRFSLGNDFTHRVVRRLEHENAPAAGPAAAVVAPARRTNSWRTYAWLSTGVAALVAVGLFVLSQNTHTSVAVNPLSAPQESKFAVPPVAPSTHVVQESHATQNAEIVTERPSPITAPIVSIGGSKSGEAAVAEKPPASRVAVASVASAVRQAVAAEKPATENKPELAGSGEMLVLEIDAAPAANRTLALAAAMSASKIRLESPLRVGATGAEGEGVTNAATPGASKSISPTKVEYFIIEGERANVAALVAQLRGKKQAFPRVENPTGLAEAIDRLAVLDKAQFGEFLPDVNLPAAASVAGSAAAPSAASFAVKPQGTTNAKEAPESVPTAQLNQARAYRVSSPTELLSAEKSPAGVHSVRVLLIVQNSGVAVEEPKPE